MKTLDQIRAEFSWEKVSQVKKDPKAQFKEYVPLVKKLPAMIATNGLGQAMAFLAGKAGMTDAGEIIPDKKVEGRVYAQIEEWLFYKEGHYQGPYHTDASGKLLLAITQNDSGAYRQAQGEALAILNYLRMFAAGLKDRE